MDIVHTTSRVCDTALHAVYPRKNGRKAVNDADLRSPKKGAKRFTGTQGHPGQGCRHAWPVRDMSPRHHQAGTSGLCGRICPRGAERGRADAIEGTTLTGGGTRCTLFGSHPSESPMDTPVQYHHTPCPKSPPPSHLRYREAEHVDISQHQSTSCSGDSHRVRDTTGRRNEGGR